MRLPGDEHLGRRVGVEPAHQRGQRAGVEVGELVEGGAAYESGEVMEGDVLMRVGRADVSRLGFDQVMGDVGEI